MYNNRGLLDQNKTGFGQGGCFQNKRKKGT